MRKVYRSLLIILLIALIGIPRFVALDDFVTVDEPFWLPAGANFYYALGQREFRNTIITYHPAVTTMWIVAAGMFAYFPEYRSLEQGYLKRGKFDLFLYEHGRDPLQLLVYGRFIQEVVIVLLLLAIYLLLSCLFGGREAFAAVFLISLSPYFLGHSRVLNHEAMLGLFIMISLLSMAAYLFKGRNMLLLIVSACSGALAQLTKSSAILLFPAIVISYLFYLIGTRRKFFWEGLWDMTRILGGWMLILIAAYVLIWPAMWVTPGDALYEVYGNAFSYAFRGTGLGTTQAADSLLRLNLGLGDIWKFALGMLWRTTPVTWLGFIFAIRAIFPGPGGRAGQIAYLWIAAGSLLVSAFFVLTFGLAQGRDSPHYILTSYIAVDCLAGLGWAHALDWLVRISSKKFQILGVGLAVFGAAAVQLVSVAKFYPYYYTYYNPLLESLQPGMQRPRFEYGEGLDQAAAYLSQKAGASQMTVMSFSGYGCFSFFFPGTTIPINSLSLDHMDPDLLEALHHSDYVVVDYDQQKAQGLLDGLDKVAPEKIVQIDGIDKIYIYRASDLLGYLKNTPP